MLFRSVVFGAGHGRNPVGTARIIAWPPEPPAGAKLRVPAPGWNETIEKIDQSLRSPDDNHDIYVIISMGAARCSGAAMSSTETCGDYPPHPGGNRLPADLDRTGGDRGPDHAQSR